MKLVNIAIILACASHLLGEPKSDVSLLKNRIAKLSISSDEVSQSQKILNQVYACRISVQLRGYESDPNFIAGLLELKRINDSSNHKSSQTIPDDVIDILAESYIKNSDEFSLFYREELTNLSALKEYNKEQIEDAIIIDAIQAYNIDPDLFNIKWKFTYIHPFCKPIDPEIMDEDLPSLYKDLELIVQDIEQGGI